MPPELTKNGPAFLNDPNTIESQFFAHVFMGDGQILSEYFEFVRPILYFLEKEHGVSYRALDRVKANLMLKDSVFPKDAYNTPHSDSRDPEMQSFLYYVNDSDGDTVAFNETELDCPDILTIKSKYTPKKNCGLLMPSIQYHASSPPRGFNTRLNILFVFK